MKQMKKDLENRYIADREYSKDQIKTLTAAIIKQHRDIEKYYLPQLQELIKENIKLQQQLYEAVRAYHALAQWGLNAEELGINIKDIKLPESDPYEGFEMNTKLMESGKVRAVVKLRKNQNK